MALGDCFVAGLPGACPVTFGPLQECLMAVLETTES